MSARPLLRAVWMLVLAAVAVDASKTYDEFGVGLFAPPSTSVHARRRHASSNADPHPSMRAHSGCDKCFPPPSPHLLPCLAPVDFSAAFRVVTTGVLPRTSVLRNGIPATTEVSGVSCGMQYTHHPTPTCANSQQPTPGGSYSSCKYEWAGLSWDLSDLKKTNPYYIQVRGKLS